MANELISVMLKSQTTAPVPTRGTIPSVTSGTNPITIYAGYNEPQFAGIYITRSGGGNTALVLEVNASLSGKKFIMYANFNNTWYIYEVQVWQGPATYQILNPGSGSGQAQALAFSSVYDIFSPYAPEDIVDLPAPPPIPTHNPFKPWLVITGSQDELGRYLNEAFATLHGVLDVTIDNVAVYLDGNLISVTRSILESGHLFNVDGNYEIVINYHYKTLAPDVLRRSFTIFIDKRPPFMQLEKIIPQIITPNQAVLFSFVKEEHNMMYDTMTGLITFMHSGVYFIKWFIATKTSLATDRGNFGILFNNNSSATIIASSHARFSHLVGFAILEVQKPNLQSVQPSVALINTSNRNIALSDETIINSGIVAFKISELPPPILLLRAKKID